MPARRPPLETLRFFEVASRHLNFSSAANELCVTHGAVSQRIKALEEYVETSLFERHGRSMRLTTSGRELRVRVSTALSDIDRALDLIRPGNSARSLTVSVLPIFATRWLIPRLHRFGELHPDIGVNIRAGQALTDFERDDVDVAVRFGTGSWPNLHADKLFDDQLFPVCAPELVAASQPKDPSQLLSLPLLHDERQPWSVWFDSVGYKLPRQLPGPVYGDANLLLDAAIAGHGVVLARATLVKPELDTGRLVRLFEHSVKTRFSHYLVYLVGSDRREEVEKFKKWILGEARSTTRGLRRSRER